mgnify:CR=1 FL=1
MYETYKCQIRILILHFPKREFLKSSLKFSGVMQCNQFLNEEKLAKSILSFKKLVRKWLGLDKMNIFKALNFCLFYYYQCYYFSNF